MIDSPQPTSFWSSQKVLVTGGAGFVGSHLCERLLHEGAQVVAVDNLLTGSEENISTFRSSSAFRFVNADVSQSPINYLPEGFIPTVVLHFASPASPPRYQEHPVETYLVNSLATHELLKFLMEHAPSARFLFASTSEVYGDPLVHPQPESYWGNVNPNGIRSCYDESKRMGETICGVFERHHHLDTRIVRIFNTYGPRMDLEDGRVIPDFIQAIRDQKPFPIYGTGEQTRSYCYVADLVEGILLLAAHPEGKGQTVNLGNPGEYTIKDTARIMAEAAGTSLELDMKPLPGDDPKRRKPDITKAQQLLGWNPNVSFEEGVRLTLATYGIGLA